MYLVIGGTGLIGQALVRRLSKKGRVRVLARKEITNNNLNVEYVFEDFRAVDFEQLLEGVDKVYHLISSSLPVDGIENLKEDFVNDFEPTFRLLDTMIKKGIKTIYFASSGGTIYGDCGDKCGEDFSLDPICTYGLSKLYLEQSLKLYEKYKGIKSFVLRIGNPYGFDRDGKKQGIIPIFAKKIMNGETIDIWGDGANERDYIFIEDVIDAFEALEQYKGTQRIFNIGTGVSISTMRIISILCEELKKTVNICFLPERLCDVKRASMDVSLMKKECGWESKVTIEEGIKIFLKEWRA